MRELAPDRQRRTIFFAAAVFTVLGRRFALLQSSIEALILVCGLGNNSFVGQRMIESLHGRDGLGLGLLIDQFRSYLALSTIGIFVVTLCAAPLHCASASHFPERN